MEWATPNHQGAARSISVEVYEADTFSGDDFVDQTQTDQSGYFSTVFPQPESGGSELYLKLYANNPATFTVRDNTWGGESEGDSYRAETAVVSDVSGGDGLYCWTMEPETHDKAWFLADLTLESQRFMQDESEWSRSKLPIIWPSDTDTPAYDYEDEEILFPDTATFEWEEDGHYVPHEYGHAVLDSAYSGDAPHGGGPHFVYSETDENFAVAEGWAEFFAAAVMSNPELITSPCSDRGLNDNYWHMVPEDLAHCGTPSNAPKPDAQPFDGDQVEGSFASILWDLNDSDDEDSDRVAVTFDTIFDLMRKNKVQKVHDLWSSWSGDRYAFKDILYEYGVNKNGKPSIETPSPPSEGWINPPSCCGQKVPLDPSDPDDDPIHLVEVQYSRDGGETWQSAGTDQDPSDGWSIYWGDASDFTDGTVWLRARSWDGIGDFYGCADWDNRRECGGYDEPPAWSNWALSTSWKLDNTRPEYPHDLSSNRGSGYTKKTDVTWSWAQSSDEGAGLDGYEYSLDSSDFDRFIDDPSTTSKSYSDLSDGSHTFHIRSLDLANPPMDSGAVEHTVKIDTVAPKTTSDAPDGEWITRGEVDLTSRDRIGDESTDPAGIDTMYWEVENQGKSSEGDGQHTLTLDDGKHDLRYWAVDQAGAGNEEAETTQEVWVDTELPQLDVSFSPTEPSGKHDWYHQPVEVTIDCKDETSGVPSGQPEHRFGDDEGWRHPLGEDNRYTITIDDEGVTKLRARCSDEAGNKKYKPARGGWYQIKIDTNPPDDGVTPEGDEGNNGWYRSDVQAFAECSPGDGSKCWYTEMKVDDGEWERRSSLTVSDPGNHEVCARATDYSDRTSSGSCETVKIDKTQPDLSVSQSPAEPNGDNEWYTSEVTFESSCSDETSGVSEHEYAIDDRDEWNDYIRPFTVGDGRHTVWIRCSDNAGNEDENETRIKVDTSAPETNLTVPGLSDGPYDVDWETTDSVSELTGRLYVLERSSDEVSWEVACSYPVSGEQASGECRRENDPGTYCYGLRVRDVAGNIRNTTEASGGGDSSQPCTVQSSHPGPSPDLQRNPDGSYSVYDDGDSDGEVDDGEEIARTPRPPKADHQDDENRLVLYDDRDGDSQPDSGEEIATLPTSVNPSLRENDDGSRTVYNDRDNDGRQDSDERTLGTIPPTPDPGLGIEFGENHVKIRPREGTLILLRWTDPELNAAPNTDVKEGPLKITVPLPEFGPQEIELCHICPRPTAEPTASVAFESHVKVVVQGSTLLSEDLQISEDVS